MRSKKNKSIKIISSTRILIKIILLVIILQFSIFVNASRADWGDIINYGSNFIEKGEYQANQDSNSANDEDIMKIMNDIYGILFPLGVVITVAVGGVLGTKFMLASAEDKAKVKESMIPYAIGCAVIYGAFGIWKICIQIFSAF